MPEPKLICVACQQPVEYSEKPLAYMGFTCPHCGEMDKPAHLMDWDFYMRDIETSALNTESVSLALDNLLRLLDFSDMPFNPRPGSVASYINTAICCLKVAKEQSELEELLMANRLAAAKTMTATP